MKVQRISIGPGEVAGYFSKLKIGFDELGIKSEHFVLTSNKFNYQESGYFLRNFFIHISGLRESKYLVLKYLGYFIELILRLVVFVYTLIKFDVFIFSGSGSFFKFYELPILKFLGKKIIVVYLGSDARPDYLSGRYLDDIGKPFDCVRTEKKTFQQVRRIQKVERYADIIVNHTATAQLFKRDFIRLQALGTPTKSLDSVSERFKSSRVIRIVHAPSRPLAKGSLVFKKIIKELRMEGHEIDFIELVGVPNSLVLKELSNCDFVLDELYSDAPMAMLATEAAMFAKPVIVGGYYAEQYKIDNLSSELPPTLYVLPNEIKQAIRKLIDDKGFRLELGKRAFDFVTYHWNVSTVAKNYLRLIENEPIPDNWICDPEKLSYYWGWGLSKDNWRQQVSNYITYCGVESLNLEHNHRLMQKILDEVKNS